jgi:hypothetical protein
MSKDNIFILNTISYSRPNTNRIYVEYEPKRKNRFKVEFPNYFEIESFVVQKISKPKLNFINNDYIWENIEIELIDLIGPSTSRGIMNLIEHCQLVHKEDNEQKILFNFLITDLDPVGAEVQVWIVDVKELVSVEFGTNNYEDGDVQICKILIKPQRCRIQQ